MPIDVEAAKAFRADATAGVKRLLDQVRGLAGNAELNPASTQQVEAALTERNVDLSGLPRTEKAGQLMLTAQTLESIDDDLARALLDLRAEKKMLDYAEGSFRHTHGDRLYGTFRQVGTATGRMSSGHPNLQNFPKDDPRVRNLIRAGEGKTLVGADLDSIELRLLAHYAPRWCARYIARQRDRPAPAHSGRGRHRPRRGQADQLRDPVRRRRPAGRRDPRLRPRRGEGGARPLVWRLSRGRPI